jgi:hypothetical protein
VGSLHPSSSDRHPTTNVSGFSLVDAYVSKRVLSGHHLNGCLASVSEPLRPLLEYLDTLSGDEQLAAWHGALAVRADCEAIRQAVFNADPDGPMPDPAEPRQFATGADLEQASSAARWHWEGWIPADSIFGVAAPEGTGKTLYFVHLAGLIHDADPWPDGQEATFPKGSRTLWVCADGHQPEVVARARATGLPPGEIIFPAPRDEPMANTSLDDEEARDWIEDAIATHRPALTFIDTLTYATTLDLCEQRSIARLKLWLVRLCQDYQISIGLGLHVSREGVALGRRIRGLTRVLQHLECPNPETNPERLRLWVDKTFARKPTALGCTILDDGMKCDPDAPPRAVRNAAHRPPSQRAAATQFIRDELAKQNDQIGNELARQWKGGSQDTFWRAVREMVNAGELATDGGPGTRQQTILHLPQKSAEA